MALFDLEQLLKEVKENLIEIYGNRLKKVVLYGSYARKTQLPESDIDILVVLDGFSNVGVEITKLSPFSSELSLKYDVTISLIPAREKDFTAKKSPLLKNIAQEGIAV